MKKINYKCPKCTSLNFKNFENSITCEKCLQEYSIIDGVIDFLFEPSKDVIKELTGMALENNYDPKDYLKFKIKYPKNPIKISEKLKSTQGDYNQYYQQTLVNFYQAFEQIKNDYNFKKAKVLEIGSCLDYYFLKPFKELGAECFALNIHFNLVAELEFKNFPHKILADMNGLPFADNSFEVIVISATSHHSNTPDLLIKEISRVLKPNGQCLMINDPISGLIKNLGKELSQVRHDHINENEYTLQLYNQLFKKYDLKYTHLFSEYHDLKLQSMKIHPKMRFARIAKLITYFWKINFLRKFLKNYCLSIAQKFFGFPMNVILKKESK